MHDVLDDRSAEGAAKLLVLGGRLDVRVRGELGRGLAAEILSGVRAEDLAFELVGAGPGPGGDGGTRDLVVFGLVVGRDDLVLTDRELWEGIALGEKLTADTTF